MIEKVQKIRIFTLKSEAKKILEKLGELSCVNFTQISKIPEKNQKETKEILENLEIIEKITPLLRKKNKEESKVSAEEFLPLGIKILKEVENLKKEKEELTKEIESIKRLKKLNFGLIDLNKSKNFKFFLIEGNKKLHKKLKEELEEHIVYQEIERENKNSLFLYGLFKDKEEKFLSVVEKYKLKKLEIPYFSPKKEYEKKLIRLKDVELEIENLLKKLEKISPSLKEWENFKNIKNFEFQIHSILSNSKETEKFSIVEGWIPESHYEKLKSELERNFNFVFIEKLPFSPEEAPVLLKNNFAKIFEPITRLYGLPKPNEIDPTPFLAPFFIILFGFALSDLGYGILMLVFGLISLFKIKSELGEIIGKLSILLGISTCIFGILFGTFFGKEIALLLNPLKEPFKVLGICFIIGLTQISLGLLLSFIHQLKNGKKLIKAITDHLSLLPVLLLIIIYILESIFNKFYIPQNIILNLIIFSLMIKLILHYLSEKNIIKGSIKALGSFYNSLSLLSDTLSFARIYALGLATGVIASTVNLIAELVKNSLGTNSIFSYLIVILILMVGHLFSIVINIWGSFLHSARLQLVEFFSKFLEGGGRPFQPLKIIKK